MNLYTLHNDTLTVALDACGAVLHSIGKDGKVTAVEKK